MAKFKVDIDTFSYPDLPGKRLWGFRFYAIDRTHAYINFNSEAEALAAGKKHLTKILRSKPRKPVVEVTTKEMWKYEFQAKNAFNSTILACDSLENLKREIKNRRWKEAHISAKEGVFNVGQTLVDEYPYEPDYRRKE